MAAFLLWARKNLITLPSHVSLSLKPPPVESVVPLCFAAPVCTTLFRSGCVWLLYKVNVVGSLKKFKSLSETLSVLASLNFWSMCPDSCKSTLNNWTSLPFLKRPEEQWPPELFEGTLATFSPYTAMGTAIGDQLWQQDQNRDFPWSLAEYRHSLQFFWVLQNFFQTRES